MIKDMVSSRKTKLLQAELNLLDDQERDHIEKLAKSLLYVQKTASTETGEKEQGAAGGKKRRTKPL